MTGTGLTCFRNWRMEKEKFEEITDTLIKIYRNQGEVALFAEVDRINKELNPQLLVLIFLAQLRVTASQPRLIVWVLTHRNESTLSPGCGFRMIFSAA